MYIIRIMKKYINIIRVYLFTFISFIVTLLAIYLFAKQLHSFIQALIDTQAKIY